MGINIELNKMLGRALDPVHVGAGGYRLGIVDNTIVRDPVTEVPKIPGTSISGVVRAFYSLYLSGNDSECGSKIDENEKKECVDEKVRVIFGHENQKGIIRFYDGQIIFFPVSSIQGTVWITTKELIEYWFGGIKNVDNGIKIKIPDEKLDSDVFISKGINLENPLNLGWLLLKAENNDKGRDVTLPGFIDSWVKRIVIVSEKMFSHIVNDNLEIRTSVKIDPDTGTAEEGKLFTYEAIPRGTIFGFEVSLEKYRNVVNRTITIDSIISKVAPYFQLLGIGGMGTRGFGRIELKIYWGNS